MKRNSKKNKAAHQTGGLHVSVIQGLVLEQSPEVRDVTGGQPQGVQLGQLGIGGYPGQGGLQPGEGFAQHPHPGPFASVGRVPVRLFPSVLRSSVLLVPAGRHDRLRVLGGVCAYYVQGGGETNWLGWESTNKPSGWATAVI